MNVRPILSLAGLSAVSGVSAFTSMGLTRQGASQDKARAMSVNGKLSRVAPHLSHGSGSRSLAIKTGEFIEVPQGGEVDRIRTKGLGCCVALAMRGDHVTSGAREVFLAHLDSQQYTPPGDGSGGLLGGKTDAQLAADDDVRQENRAETVQKTRAFARTHDNLEAIAVTNYLSNPLNLGQCLFLKLAVSPPPVVYFLDENASQGGSVELDVADFVLYKLDPDSNERLASVRSLAPMPVGEKTVSERPTKSQQRKPFWKFWDD